LKLRLNPKLLYEASIPHSSKIEYFVTVIPEKGEPSEFGSEMAPKTLETEGLARVRETKHAKLKLAVFAAVAVVVAVVFAIGELTETVPRKKK
jgi:hypothetical protein